MVGRRKELKESGGLRGSRGVDTERSVRFRCNCGTMSRRYQLLASVFLTRQFVWKTLNTLWISYCTYEFDMQEAFVSYVVSYLHKPTR